MRFEIIFENVTPIHSSAPGDARVDLSGNFVNRDTGFPCTRTRRTRMLVKHDEEPARRIDVPIIPANTLRHQLRERIVEHLFDAMRGRYSISPGAFATALCGSATGNPDGVPLEINEFLEWRKHPLFGLFGGGPRMLEGLLMVDSAYALAKDNIHHLLPERPELAAAVSSFELLERVPQRRVDPVLGIDEDELEIVRDGASAVTEYSAALAESAAKKKKGKDAEAQASDDAGERGLKAFNFHEVVIPGATWMWRISTRRSLTDAQLGALLDSLQQMPDHPIGGGSRLGYGNIRIRELWIDGTNHWAGNGLAESELVQGALEAWAEAIDEVKDEDFERFAGNVA